MINNVNNNKKGIKMLQVVDVDLTPNPQALKFHINERLLNRETRHYKNKNEAVNDPLAKSIFDLEGVVSVFYMDKFITIEKQPEVDWGRIQRPFVSLIQSFDKSLIPDETETTSTEENSNEVLMQINDLLDKRVRPYLAGDGGGLEVLGLVGNRLKIRYQGACGSCPSAISGTLTAIETMIRREVNPAIEVEAS